MTNSEKREVSKVSSMYFGKAPTRSAPGDGSYVSQLEEYIAMSPWSGVEKFENFTKYVPRWSLMRFLTKYELFRKILDVQGAIIEGGVYQGGGLMAWAQLSAILEPYNHQRHVIGFDTFKGFSSIDEKDGAADPVYKEVGAWAADSFEDLSRSAQIHDISRPMGHIPKVELVKGDVMETADKFLEENPHTLVSLLYLDVDLYAPTRKLLEVFVPRMSKGAIVVFDQIDTIAYPGETLAVDEYFGIRNLEIQRFPFGTSITYAVLK